MDKTGIQNIDDRRTDLLYAISARSGIILIISSLVLVFFFYKRLNQYPIYHSILTVWLPLSITASVIKIALAVIYNNKSEKNKKIWLRIFYLTTTISGLMFGSYLFFMHHIDDEMYNFFTFFLIGTLTAGSTGVLAVNIRAYLIFNILAMLPYSLYSIIVIKGDFSSFGLFIILFMFTNFLNAHRQYRQHAKSFNLSIENDLIIEKLAQSEEKFSKSFYSGIAPMAMVNFKNARFIDANDAMLSLLQYSREEIIGKTPYDLEIYQKTEGATDLVLEAYSKKSLSNREVILYTGDGKKIHCIVTVEKFILDGEEIALVMLQDFTDRFEYEKQLKIERDRAEKAASVKDRFLGTISHEIRTPMTSVLGMTNLAMLTDDPKEREEYLGVVKESGVYLLGLIDDILDLLKLQAGKIEIEPVDLDINEVVRSAYRTMEMLALSKKLIFEYSISPEVPLYIRSSPERIKQILFNLIGNAIKFTSEGSIRIEVSISDGTGYSPGSGAGQFIEFSVTDTGIGIPPEQRHKIFEAFTQADAGTFRKYGGTGLGLAICRQMSRLLKGDIIVQSNKGLGSRFSFIIPLIPGEKPLIEDDKIYMQTKPVMNKNILIAEDNIMNQKLIKAYMKNLGLSFTLVETGIEVIEKLKGEKFDVVLMDIEMPLMDGHDAMKNIRSGSAGVENTGIPIFAMSAHVMQETISRCIEDGFTGYIIKPLDLKRLREIIQHI